MTLQLLLTAVALMLVFEGMMPFLAPGLWREMLRRVAGMDDGRIRFLGLTLMLVGILILYFARD